MKNLFCFLFLFASMFSFAQETEEAEVKKVVTDFFDAFHSQDSTALKYMAHTTITMQSVATVSNGETKLSTAVYDDFVKSITGIPSTTKFEEKLHSYDIRVNGPLATVITPYSFYLNDTLSHCGVNSFTMVKEADHWKIVYLIDTRTKAGCSLSQSLSSE